MHIEAEILAASRLLQVPGSGERRVLSPSAVSRIAENTQSPAWEVEATALDSDIVPLHYLRNLANWTAREQAGLLRASVTLIGQGPVLERALELLALTGVGRLSVYIPISADTEQSEAMQQVQALAAAATNRNASCGITTGVVSLKTGGTGDAFHGQHAVAACLEDSASEQLLYFACRLRRVPLVLVAADGDCAQATTIFPGDPGIAPIYRADHPHLEASRAGAKLEQRTILTAGAWMAEELTRILLDNPNVLRGRLLYANLRTEEIGEYSLS